jgi:predicted DsbA family dithiol-disulfide isomerase
MATTQTSETLTVYADPVCPFCYLGRASLREYLADAADPPAVQWRQFDLRGYKRAPDGSIQEDVDDGKDEAYFEQAKQNVARLREKYDVEMIAFDDVPDVDSRDAQQASLFVEQTESSETFRGFYEGLFEALWKEGREIDEPDVIASVAEDAGVDSGPVRDAISDETLESELRERFAEGQQLGISGVPTFVYGEHAARGAVPPEHLARLVGE